MVFPNWQKLRKLLGFLIIISKWIVVNLKSLFRFELTKSRHHTISTICCVTGRCWMLMCAHNCIWQKCHIDDGMTKSSLWQLRHSGQPATWLANVFSFWICTLLARESLQKSYSKMKCAHWDEFSVRWITKTYLSRISVATFIASVDLRACVNVCWWSMRYQIENDAKSVCRPCEKCHCWHTEMPEHLYETMEMAR